MNITIKVLITGLFFSLGGFVFEYMQAMPDYAVPLDRAFFIMVGIATVVFVHRKELKGKTL